MADEEDLKQGENGSPSDGDQSDEETSDSSDEEKVSLPKSELEQLKEEKENYKQGLLSVKQELNEQEDDDEEEEVEKDLDEPVTRKEFYEQKQEEAKELASDNLPKFDKYEKEIARHFNSKRGKDTAKKWYKDFKDAWVQVAYEKGFLNEVKEDDSAASELSSESSQPSQGDSGKAKEDTTEDLDFGSSSGPEDWYDSEESDWKVVRSLIYEVTYEFWTTSRWFRKE